MAFVTLRAEVVTQMPPGVSSPETSEAFTVRPEVVYSPIVSPYGSVTKRSVPAIAMPVGKIDTETREALTVAPEVVYSPIVLRPPEVRDKQVRSRDCNFNG